MLRILIFTFLIVVLKGYGQDRPVKIVTEELPNRLAFYAVNENEKDLDVLLELKGTNFRQSRAKPRFIRVPASSKVLMKTVVLMRGKQPVYTYNLVVNDSLSGRSLQKEYEAIKIKPRKTITVYIPENCQNCDGLLNLLANGKYLFTTHKLVERPKIKDQLNRSFADRISLDSLRTPIVNLGGKLFTRIATYEQLLAELNKD